MANKSFPAAPEDQPATPPGNDNEAKSFSAFRTVMNSLVGDFFTSFDLLPLSVFEDAGSFMPRISIAHDQQAVTVTAELPGMEVADIEVTLGEGALMIQGQRKASGEGRKARFAPEELQAPFFRKVIPIPFFIDAQGARATFKDRVLRVMLPRRPGDHPTRIRIPIKA